MARTMTKGYCFLCGAVIAKSGFQRHLSSKHPAAEKDGQECVLIKVEDTCEKLYWLYLDMPVTSTLKTLDSFLREIWLECCGHMSGYFLPGRGEVGKNTRLSALPLGTKLEYEYDFGSTTQLRITLLSGYTRPKQRKAVRLLGRNVPLHFPCRECGEEAEHICCECDAMGEYPFLCEACMKTHSHEFALPVVNSPRMGVCGYCGEYDVYEVPDPIGEER